MPSSGNVFLQMFSSCFLLSDIKHVFNVFYSHIDVFYNYAVKRSSGKCDTQAATDHVEFITLVAGERPSLLIIIIIIIKNVNIRVTLT